MLCINLSEYWTSMWGPSQCKYNKLKLAFLSCYTILKKDVLPLGMKFSKATTTSTTKQLTKKTSQETEENRQTRQGESSLRASKLK